MNASWKMRIILTITAVCGLVLYAGCGSKDESGQSEEKTPVYTSEALLEVDPMPPFIDVLALFTAKDYSGETIIYKRNLMNEVFTAVAADKDVQQTVWYKAGKPEEAVERLRKNIKISIVPETRFIKITMDKLYGEDTPVIVNAVCDAFADYMNRQVDEQISNLENERARLSKELDAVIKEQSELTGRNTDSETSQKLETLKVQRELIEDKIGRLDNRLLELQLLSGPEKPVKLRSRAMPAQRKN